MVPQERCAGFFQEPLEPVVAADEAWSLDDLEEVVEQVRGALYEE